MKDDFKIVYLKGVDKVINVVSCNFLFDWVLCYWDYGLKIVLISLVWWLYMGKWRFYVNV